MIECGKMLSQCALMVSDEGYALGCLKHCDLRVMRLKHGTVFGAWIILLWSRLVYQMLRGAWAIL